jgi:DNA polymerase III delta subunit
MSDQKMADILHIRPFFLNKYIRQANAYDTANLKKALILLMETDLQLKTSARKPKLLIETLLFTL